MDLQLSGFDTDNHLNETVLMKGHNIGLDGEIRK